MKMGKKWSVMIGRMTNIMKTKILFITSLLLIVGCSKPVEDSTLINKDGLMYLSRDFNPYSGEVVGYYMTGEKMYDGVYKDGVLVGDYIYYKKDGNKKEPINYETTLIERDGVYYTKDTNKPYSGPVFSLFESGRKKEKGILMNGIMRDITFINEYWKSGGVSLERTYKNYSKNTFTDTEYFENGQKKSSKIYMNGKFVSIKCWSENGNVRECDDNDWREVDWGKFYN